jgi:AraC-like DNA-binding protein
MLKLQGVSNRQALATGNVTAASRQELFRRLVRVRDYIYSCYDKDLSLGGLADVACLNPFYLLRQFKQTFGQTPHQFLMARRMSQAARLLSGGQMSVLEVCLSVGYSDPSSFTKLFLRHMGKTPTEFHYMRMAAGGDQLLRFC